MVHRPPHVPPVLPVGAGGYNLRLATDAPAHGGRCSVGKAGALEHGGEAKGGRGGAAAAKGRGRGVRGEPRVVPRHPGDELPAKNVQGTSCSCIRTMVFVPRCFVPWYYL